MSRNGANHHPLRQQEQYGRNRGFRGTASRLRHGVKDIHWHGYAVLYHKSPYREARWIKWGDTPLALLFLSPIPMFSFTFLISRWCVYYSETAACLSTKSTRPVGVRK